MGDYVVVWQGDSSYFGTGQEGTSYSIYAQRYNAAGAAQGSQFRVNSSTTGDQIAPTVAMDAVGDFVIAWDNDHGAGSGFSIYAQRYNASGVAQGSEFLVAAYSTGSMAPPFPASSPVAAMDSAGDIVITWDTPEQITDVGGLGDVSVLAQRYNASGEAQGPEFQVNDSGLLAFSTSLSAAMDSGGDFVITWAGYHGTSPGFGGIFAQRYNSSGVAQGSNFQVDSLPQSFSPEEPAVAIDSAGDFVIAWSYPIDGGIRAQRYNAAGVAQGSEFQADTFSTTFQGFASVAMDSAGDFVVAWSNNGFDSNHDGVYAQRYNPAGAAEGSEFRINTYTSTLGFQNTPSAAMDSAGDFVIAWQSFDQDGSGYGIYAQRYSISPQQTPSPISQQGTTLTIDASGLVGPFFFEFETATTFDFTYNGTTYFYGTASVSQVIFNGVAGASSEVVFYDNLSTDAYAANQSFSSTTVTRTGGVSFEFDANNVSTFYAYVSDPSSTATVNVADGSGANFFVDAQGNSSDSDYSYIADPIQGIYSELSGFGPETVTGSGGSTYAYVYSTSSANFVGDPGGSTYTVLSLLSILSLRTMPVVNQSALDSGTVDSITLYPTFTTTFDSFSQLYVVGASDGSDSVTLHTQGGSFVGTPSFSSVGGTFNGQPFLIGALYAAHVTAQATNPTDSAFFYSSAGNAFEGTTGSGGSTLTGSAAGFAGFPTFVSQAIGFQSVTVMESGTGTDVANLTSPGNGVFNSTPTVSTLAVDGVTVFTVLTSFTNVITAGGSSTTVFAAVPAVVNFIGASDGSDTANLYDGAGDNDVVAAGSDVTLTRALNSVKASQVGYVLAYQTLGSNDEASVASIDYTLQLIGDWKGA
jgi:hypothetical protein